MTRAFHVPKLLHQNLLKNLQLNLARSLRRPTLVLSITEAKSITIMGEEEGEEGRDEGSIDTTSHLRKSEYCEILDL